MKFRGGMVNPASQEGIFWKSILYFIKSVSSVLDMFSVNSYKKNAMSLNYPSWLLLSLKYWQLTFLACMCYVPNYSDHVMLSREFAFRFLYVLHT